MMRQTEFGSWVGSGFIGVREGREPGGYKVKARLETLRRSLGVEGWKRGIAGPTRIHLQPSSITRGVGY